MASIVVTKPNKSTCVGARITDPTFSSVSFTPGLKGKGMRARYLTSVLRLEINTREDLVTALSCLRSVSTGVRVIQSGNTGFRTGNARLKLSGFPALNS